MSLKRVLLFSLCILVLSGLVGCRETEITVKSELCAQTSSPAIRTQADGYPGIPIIGRQELNEYRKKIVKKNKQAAKNVLGLYYNKKRTYCSKNDD